MSKEYKTDETSKQGFIEFMNEKSPELYPEIEMNNTLETLERLSVEEKIEKGMALDKLLEVLEREWRFYREARDKAKTAFDDFVDSHPGEKEEGLRLADEYAHFKRLSDYFQDTTGLIRKMRVIELSPESTVTEIRSHLRKKLSAMESKTEEKEQKFEENRFKK
jgi:hypothetical protein